MRATDGLVPVTPSPGPVESSIVVSGGVGSIRFQWSELRQGAVRLGLLADSIRDALHQCGELQWRLQMLLNEQDTMVQGAGVAAVTGLDDARTALAAADNELRDTAQRVEACRLAYEAAEAMARLASAAARTALGEVERDLARVIGLANAGDLAEPSALSVERLSPVVELTLDGSVPALLDRVQVVNADGPGAFEVLKVQGTEGPVFVVVLPGTQGSSITASTHPFDPTGIVEAVQYDSAFVTEAVGQALAESGAVPGDRVMVVGYSQGGMHAANIAQNEGFADTYHLELVLTAGSPTGREPSGGAQYLHLEHADDWVPQVDGVSNPDERDRVTVTLQDPVTEVPDGDKGLGAAHKLGTYLAGAEAVEASSHPSVVATVATLRAAIGTRVPAERHVFIAHRPSVEGRTSSTDQRRRGHRPTPGPAPEPGRSVGGPQLPASASE
ncbi:hypothetical protein [Arthrobacter flavus]|uniref:PE-PPE domain-containing protein n=1 Tax=Arthrobacter flavus TaxID=95172 RepID=A0ABW4Q500_9MICC